MTQIALCVINHVTILANVGISGKNPIRLMGILNISPESFYKDSIKITKACIATAVRQMEDDGADFIDVGGMSTAPYLSTNVSEKIESKRILSAVKIIQNVSNLPISVDTCRSEVARTALEHGVEIINDISGLKHDIQMAKVISSFNPSLILCAFSPHLAVGNHVNVTKKLLHESVELAKTYGILHDKIVLDPAIGFFRKSGKGTFFTKIRSDWVKRDMYIIQNLSQLKQDFPLLVSVSNKSFLGNVLRKKNTSDRLFGSIAAEVVSVLNGASVIRTHNVGATKDAITIASKLKHKGL